MGMFDEHGEGTLRLGLPPTLWKRLSVHAKAEGRSVEDLLRDALVQHLDHVGSNFERLHGSRPTWPTEEPEE